MITFLKRLLNVAREYTILDFACLKITLLACGLLIGAYFSEFFLNHTFFLWVVFLVTFIWIMYRTLFRRI